MQQADKLYFFQGEDCSDRESNTQLILPLDADKRTIGHHHGMLLARQDTESGREWRADEEVRETASEQYRSHLVLVEHTQTYVIVELHSYCIGFLEGYRSLLGMQEEAA